MAGDGGSELLGHDALGTGRAESGARFAGLPRDVPLLLFGAMGGGRDPRKGFDLLTAALGRL
jgi:hypothetical protein